MRGTTDQAKILNLTPPLYSYLTTQTTLAADGLLDDLVARTNALLPNHAHMVVPAEEGALLTMLARLIDARVIVEVGTFTGYSSICLARGLGAGGRLHTFDISDEWTKIAEEYWARAGLSTCIELVLGSAVETLPPHLGSTQIDLAFIDADKPGYISYWNELVPRMRDGGLIIADNTLFDGKVIDPEADPNSKAAAIRLFNAHVLRDTRVESVMLAIGDGLTLARKLPASDIDVTHRPLLAPLS
jgi:caffeoyl-CoA O-methyltransferase